MKRIENLRGERSEDPREERGFKTLESRLQAVASGEMTVIYRLKPGLQRLVTEFEDRL